MTDPNQFPTDPLERREGVAPASPIPGPQQEIPSQAASGKQFAPLMEQPDTSTPAVGKPTPMELAKGGTLAAQEISPQVLQEQIDRLQKKTEALRTQLTQERLEELSPGQYKLFNKKIAKFHESIKGASKEVGLLYEPPKESEARKDIKTFLSWVTKGQSQLENIAASLSKGKQGEISVADMLRAQAQLTAAERAINFASAVVGQITRAIGQVMQQAV
jgi:hypothetical protein